MRRSSLALATCVFALLLSVCGSALASPMVMSYQGRMVDQFGLPVLDNIYSVYFRIYDAFENGNELWSSNGYIPIQTEDGLFSHLLGSTRPIPDSLSKYDSLWIGLTVGLDPEMTPRTRLAGSLFALRALLADTAAFVANTRDLYHQIIDVNPSSVTRVPIIAHRDNSRVTLYLYGSGFQGALPAHTHDGTNAHSHEISGATEVQSASHTHAVNGSSGTGGSAHYHTGTTNPFNTSHTHSMQIDGAHHHDFWFTGSLDGLFLTHTSDYNALTAHGQVQIRTASGSVTTLRSEHSHVISANGVNHGHTFATGDANTSHTHPFSVTSGTQSASHSHSLSLVTQVFGSGLEWKGIQADTTPTSVYVYIDNIPVAGPFSGEFLSGPVDLSAFVTTTGEKFIEIREEGGTGGRITYNIFVE